MNLCLKGIITLACSLRFVPATALVCSAIRCVLLLGVFCHWCILPISGATTLAGSLMCKPMGDTVTPSSGRGAGPRESGCVLRSRPAVADAYLCIVAPRNLSTRTSQSRNREEFLGCCAVYGISVTSRNDRITSRDCSCRRTSGGQPEEKKVERREGKG